MRYFHLRKDIYRLRNHCLFSPVQIKVGLMRSGPGGATDLRIQRGKSLPLEVASHASASTVQELAANKHEAVDRNLRLGPYILLYADGSRVQYIPGGQEPFTVSRYKEFMGCPFDRLTLYLCPCSDYGRE